MSENSTIVTPATTPETAATDQKPKKGGERRRHHHHRRDPDLIEEADDIWMHFDWNRDRDGDYPQGFLEIQVTEEDKKFPRKEEIPVYTATDQFQPISPEPYCGSVQIRRNRRGRMYAIFMPNLRYYATLETGLSDREWLADYDVIRELRAELVFIKETDPERGDRLKAFHRGRIVFPHRDHVVDFEAGEKIAIYLTPFRKGMGYHAIPVRHVPTGNPGQALLVLGKKSASADGEDEGDSVVTLREKIDGLMRLFKEEPVRKNGVFRVKSSADIETAWRTVNPYVILGFRTHLDAEGKLAMTVTDAEKYFASLTEGQIKNAHRTLTKRLKLHPDLTGYSNDGGFESFAKKTGLSPLDASSQVCIFRCLLMARQNALALVGLWPELAKEEAVKPAVTSEPAGATIVRVLGQEEMEKQGIVAPSEPPPTLLTEEEAKRLAELEAKEKQGVVKDASGIDQLALSAALKNELKGLRRKSKPATSSSVKKKTEPAKIEAKTPQTLQEQIAAGVQAGAIAPTAASE